MFIYLQYNRTVRVNQIIPIYQRIIIRCGCSEQKKNKPSLQLLEVSGRQSRQSLFDFKWLSKKKSFIICLNINPFKTEIIHRLKMLFSQFARWSPFSRSPRRKLRWTYLRSNCGHYKSFNVCDCQNARVRDIHWKCTVQNIENSW